MPWYPALRRPHWSSRVLLASSWEIDRGRADIQAMTGNPIFAVGGDSAIGGDLAHSTKWFCKEIVSAGERSLCQIASCMIFMIVFWEVASMHIFSSELLYLNPDGS